MPLIFTPGQLNQRAEFYHQLGILITAGISVPQALEQLKLHPPARSYRRPISEIIEYLREGCTVTAAIEQMGAWMPSFDVALIEAGDRSGRLDACFKLLALYYRERAQMTRQMISDLMYPVFVFHFAIILFPFLSWFQGGTLTRFLCTTVGILVPLYAAVFALIYACQGKRGETWRSTMEAFIQPIPLLGTARRQLALARLAAALEALINAGVTIIEAWTLAATASGSPALRRVVRSWKEPLQSGATPGELVSRSPYFPELFANLYHTGEVSGKLDETLLRIHTIYQDEGSRKLHMVAQWTPRLVYMGVSLMVAWKVISFYAGYFAQINNIMDMK